MEAPPPEEPRRDAGEFPAGRAGVPRAEGGGRRVGPRPSRWGRPGGPGGGAAALALFLSALRRGARGSRLGKERGSCRGPPRPRVCSARFPRGVLECPRDKGL